MVTYSPISTATQVPTLQSERLILREWRESDLAPFAAMNADPRVMEHFPAPLTRAESDTLVTKIREHWAARQFGMWAVEIVGGPPFVGMCGLAVPKFEARFTPCVDLTSA